MPPNLLTLIHTYEGIHKPKPLPLGRLRPPPAQSRTLRVLPPGIPPLAPLAHNQPHQPHHEHSKADSKSSNSAPFAVKGLRFAPMNACRSAPGALDSGRSIAHREVSAPGECRTTPSHQGNGLCCEMATTLHRSSPQVIVTVAQRRT